MAFKKKPELVLDPYQRDGVNFHLSRKWSMNADVPGLGKTRQAIGTMIVLEKRTLLVVPTYLIETWKIEFERTEIIVQEWDHHSPEIRPDTEVLITSYHGMQKLRERILPVVLRVLGFEFLVIDEGHAFKTPEAERTQAIGDLVFEWRPEYFLLMTGTPTKNGNGAELYMYCLFKSLQPGYKSDFLEMYPSPYTFASHFANIRPDGKTHGIRNEVELNKLLSTFMIRRTEEMVGIKYEDPLFTQVYVKYEEDPMLLQIFEAFQGDIGLESQLKMESASCKAPFTAKYIGEKYDSFEGPFIAVSDHRVAVELMASECKIKGFGVIMGGMPTRKRDKIAADFRSGKLSGLFATVGGIKEGLNLVESNHMIENDPSWIPSDIVQVRARIRRRGQKRRCTYHQILGCTIDRKIREKLEYKVRQMKKVGL